MGWFNKKVKEIDTEAIKAGAQKAYDAVIAGSKQAADRLESHIEPLIKHPVFGRYSALCIALTVLGTLTVAYLAGVLIL